MEDTVKIAQVCIPPENVAVDDPSRYRANYFVHERILGQETDDAPGGGEAEEKEERTEIIGMVGMRPNPTFPLPEHLTVVGGPENGVLKLELGYMFLGTAWNQGFASEAVAAALGAIKRSSKHWEPYEKVYVEAIVSPDNPGSQRVCEKAGLTKVGVYEWEAERIVIGGQLRENIVNVNAIWVVGGP